MATSNSTDWTLNRDQVITGALRKLAVLPSGGVPSANQITDATASLNALVKALQADGMPLWKIKEQPFNTLAGVNTYAIGPGSIVNIPKPLKVLRVDRDNVPLNQYTRYDFKDLPTTSTGTPVNYYYQPEQNRGVMYLWPTPSDDTTTITFQYHAPYEDMDSASDDFDFPSEWIMCLIYKLAWVLSPEYGIPPTDRSILQKESQYWHDYVLSMGGEEGSLYIKPA